MDQMSPETSPGNMSSMPKVRRVNNMPVYILAGVFLMFVFVMVLVAVHRSDANLKKAEIGKAGSSTMFANAIIGDNVAGITPGPKIETKKEQIVEQQPTIQQSVIQQPITQSSNTQKLKENKKAAAALVDEEAKRIRMQKMQMLEAAVSAKIGVQQIASPAVSSSTDTDLELKKALTMKSLADHQQQYTSGEDPTDTYARKLASVQQMMSGAIGNGGGKNTVDNNVAQFESDKEDRWKLDTHVEAPRTPFELRAGFIIPAILISGINSELPGQIMGQVSQNVYDTPTGDKLLIPQGSRLVGSYSSVVSYGQERVLIGWQRIVFPDGKVKDIGAMPGADGAGYAGFHDLVNNHYLRLYGSAVLMSAVVAGVSLSQPQSLDTDQKRASDEMSAALGQQLGQVTAQLITKNMNISPTLEIRPGYRFNVIVIKDITFTKSYEAFDYSADNSIDEVN